MVDSVKLVLQTCFPNFFQNISCLNLEVKITSCISLILIKSTRGLTCFYFDRYVKGRRPYAPGVPVPQSYVCYRCGKHGHFIRNCPTNGVSGREPVQF